MFVWMSSSTGNRAQQASFDTVLPSGHTTRRVSAATNARQFDKVRFRGEVAPLETVARAASRTNVVDNIATGAKDSEDGSQMSR
jgi:hypothetical protein